MAALLLALAGTRDLAWVPLLEQYLQHPDRSVRDGAVEAIESITQEQALACQDEAERISSACD